MSGTLAIAAIVAALAVDAVDPVDPGRGRLQPAQTAEVIAEVRIHGNHLTSNDEILRLSGIEIGGPFLADSIEVITARLRSTGRFEEVDVLKRFASIADPSRVVVVIIVNEGPVRIRMGDGPDAEPEVVPRRGLRNLMFLPVLEGEDGYGLTYGVQLALVDVGGETGRVSFPLTWGGRRRAGVGWDRTFDAGPFTRVEVGVSRDRRINPAFDEPDNRTRAWARVERQVGPLRVGGGPGWEHVSFGAFDDDLRIAAVDVVLDTRLTPVLPRNAVYARAAVERIAFDRGRDEVVLTHLEVRGYVGLAGQSVLELRAAHDDAGAGLPPYLQPLLGGWSSVRGFEAGAFAGDTRVTGRAELFVPLTSVLSAGRVGVSAFVDTGAAYDEGERAADQRFRVGAGGSAWATITSVRLSLAVARGRQASTRVHFGIGIGF